MLQEGIKLKPRTPFRYLVPLSGTIDLETACLLPCSGLTAYSAIKKTKAGPSDFVVIIGAHYLPRCLVVTIMISASCCNTQAWAASA